MDDSFDKSDEFDDDQAFYNKEFVNQFFQFKSYAEAGKFIVQWIKDLKHNPTEFAQDFPALIEKGQEYREEILAKSKKESQNPES